MENLIEEKLQEPEQLLPTRYISGFLTTRRILTMGLFDATTDAIQLLDEYLQGLPAKMRKKDVELQALQKARDILRAVAITALSPYPMKTFVEEEKGRNHLKAVLTESEHTAWLTLVAQIQAEEARKKQPKKKNNYGSRVAGPRPSQTDHQKKVEL